VFVHASFTPFLPPALPPFSSRCFALGLFDLCARCERRLPLHNLERITILLWLFLSPLSLPPSLQPLRYVLTAAHCFYSNGNQIDGNNMYHSQFRAAYHTDKAGQHYYAASSTWGRLWYGTTYPEVYRNSDWAIIELEEPLGETQGYVGLNPTDLSKQLPMYNKFQLIGYSEDGYSQTAGKDPQCSLEDAYQGVYFHNCDCAAGASGGAMLDPSYNVVGINTAHVMPSNTKLLRATDYNPTYPNIAVPAYQFMPTYAHILTQMD